MKNPSKKSTKIGFTLIELLVVISIIAVLAAAGFAAGAAALNRARKVSAQSVATSVANAVEQFYSEYSALPEVGAATGLSTESGGNGVVYGTGSKLAGLYDPWGQPYFIEMDDDYDDVLDVSPGHSIPVIKLRGRKVAVYSLGVDSPSEANGSTLVKSW